MNKRIAPRNSESRLSHKLQTEIWNAFVWRCSLHHGVYHVLSSSLDTSNLFRQGSHEEEEIGERQVCPAVCWRFVRERGGGPRPIAEASVAVPRRLAVIRQANHPRACYLNGRRYAVTSQLPIPCPTGSLIAPIGSVRAVPPLYEYQASVDGSPTMEATGTRSLPVAVSTVKTSLESRI